MNADWATAQNSFRARIGLGYSEAANISLSYKLPFVELVAGIGKEPNRPSSFISAGIQLYPLAKNEMEELSKWYLKFMYTHDERKWESGQVIKFEYTNYRIGREFRINSKLGFQMDIGYLDRITAMAKFSVRDFSPIGNLGGSINFFYNIF